MGRILVVDDNEDNRSLLRILLGPDGHVVDLASDGSQALALATLNPPHLVISDLLMPVMDGYALLRRWKADERFRHVPFVICTGTYTELQDQKLAEDLGADAYLRKPLDAEELSTCVRALLARKTSRTRTARGTLSDPGQQLVAYNQVLVRKLEDKTARLERANLELGDANDRLRHLSQRILQVQEAERATIARELHDEIGQALTAIKLEAEWLACRIAEPESRKLAACAETADRALAQVRSIALELRPPQLDQLGLRAALRGLTERMAASAGLEAVFQSDSHDIAPSTPLATTAFRVAQEALTNAVRHAAAKRVTVELAQRDGELLVTVRDDGRGFDVERARQRARTGGSMGLLGMQERATLAGGWLRFRSQPGEGTCVEAGFPVSAERMGAA